MPDNTADSNPNIATKTEPITEIDAFVEHVGQVVKGKDEVIRLAVTALLAGGHLLLEDIPGVGKTTLAKSLALAIGGTFRRIQFTSDLLPSDIIGVSVLTPSTGEFSFKPGPLFANVVLADEINRTTPRTQSALLEAMSEGNITIDNQRHELPPPFFVVATQNPLDQYGTYPLPESQMDRFLMRVPMGYPDRATEKELLQTALPSNTTPNLSQFVPIDQIVAWQHASQQVTVTDELIDYCLRVVAATRSSAQISIGISTRGAIAWSKAAKAFAFVHGRSYCIPDDFVNLAVPVLAHRVTVGGHTSMSSNDSPSQGGQNDNESLITEILQSVPAPL